MIKMHRTVREYLERSKIIDWGSVEEIADYFSTESIEARFPDKTIDYQEVHNYFLSALHKLVFKDKE